MALVTEKTTVQNPFIRYTVEAGWTYLAPDEALRLRPGETSPILFSVLVQPLQNLNPGIVDHHRAEQLAKSFCSVRRNIEGNLASWEYLKGLKTVFVEAEKRERNVRLLDPVHP